MLEVETIEPPVGPQNDRFVSSKLMCETLEFEAFAPQTERVTTQKRKYEIEHCNFDIQLNQVHGRGVEENFSNFSPQRTKRR